MLQQVSFTFSGDDFVFLLLVFFSLQITPLLPFNTDKWEGISGMSTTLDKLPLLPLLSLLKEFSTISRREGQEKLSSPLSSPFTPPARRAAGRALNSLLALVSGVLKKGKR